MESFPQASARRIRNLALMSILLCAAAPAHAELPLSVQKDLFKHELVTAIKANDAARIVATVRKMRAKGIDTGSEVYFYEARAYFELRDNQAGDVALERYVQEAGPRGANYQTAIAMLSERLGKREQEQREREAAAQQAAAQQRQWSAFDAVSTRIGKIVSINTDWGYAKAALAVDDIPDGSYLYIQIATREYQPVQLGKHADGHITLTGIGKAQFPVGAALVASTVRAPLSPSATVVTNEPAFPSSVAGVRVLSVTPGSGAARAGLRAGDIIIAYGELLVHDIRELKAAIDKGGIKTTVTERVDQYGNPLAKSVQLEGMMGGMSALGGQLGAGGTTQRTREREMTPEELRQKRGSVFGLDPEKGYMAVWRDDTTLMLEGVHGLPDAELVDAR